MRKFSHLLILLMVLSLIPFSGIAIAQEGPDDIDVVADIVLPRLEEYGATLDKPYGTIGVEDFLALLAEEEVTLLDVREDTEIEDIGIIEDSIHIPLRTLGENLDLLPDLEATIVVICKTGFRATIGMAALQVLGYENARVLMGGTNAWIGEDLPLVEAAADVEAGDVPEDIDPLLLEYVADYLTNLPEGWGKVEPDALFEEMFEEFPDALIDVRGEAEWLDPGYIDGAEWIWINEFMAKMDEWPEDLDANIVIYCGSSYRGNIARVMMELLGYTNVRNLGGGLKAWIAADLPVVVPEPS